MQVKALPNRRNLANKRWFHVRTSHLHHLKNYREISFRLYHHVKQCQIPCLAVRRVILVIYVLIWIKCIFIPSRFTFSFITVSSRNDENVCRFSQCTILCTFNHIISYLIFSERAYQCSDCNIYYASPKEVDHSHLNKKRLKEDAAGHICTKDTLFKTKFPPERIWSCEHCSELFDMESQRDVHEQEVHPSKSASSSSHLKHECKTCGRKLRNLKDWSLHRAIEHPEVALLSCYFCDENFGRKTKEGIGSLTLKKTSMIENI